MRSSFATAKIELPNAKALAFWKADFVYSLSVRSEVQPKRGGGLRGAFHMMGNALHAVEHKLEHAVHELEHKVEHAVEDAAHKARRGRRDRSGCAALR